MAQNVFRGRVKPENTANQGSPANSKSILPVIGVAKPGPESFLKRVSQLSPELQEKVVQWTKNQRKRRSINVLWKGMSTVARTCS